MSKHIECNVCRREEIERNLRRINAKISTVRKLTSEEYGYLMSITDYPYHLSEELARLGVVVEDSYKSKEWVTGC